MAANPLDAFFQACNSVACCIRAHISHLVVSIQPGDRGQSGNSLQPLLIRRRSSEVSAVPSMEDSSFPREVLASRGPVKLLGHEAAGSLTKEELGKSTWTLLHAIGAQFPDNPTRQQKRDVKDLMGILSRIYPCKQCAEHFKQLLEANPVQARSHDDFSQWLCRAHNIVNRSLRKPTFPCRRVDLRWGKLDCPDHACDIEGGGSNSKV